VLMAVCRRCGLVRTEALRPHTEHRIELGGSCEVVNRPEAVQAA